MIILGIDPGLLQTGYGLIKISDNHPEVLDYGIISPDVKSSLSNRLHTIYEDLMILINNYKPTIMVIEEVFYGKNVKSALLLGHARGVPMVCASKYKIPVFTTISGAKAAIRAIQTIKLGDFKYRSLQEIFN